MTEAPAGDGGARRRDPSRPPTGAAQVVDQPGRHRAPGRLPARSLPRFVLVGPVLGLAVVLVVAGRSDRAPVAAGRSPASASPAVGSSPAVVPPAAGSSVTGPSVPATSVGEVGPGARWLPVLDQLDAVRARAYERGEVARLRLVWAPGSRLDADAARLRALVAIGCTARGVRHRFRGPGVVSVGGRRVRLRITQWLPRSERRCGRQVAGWFAGTPPTVVTADLLATDVGWRLG